MIRILATAVVALIADAIALLVAWQLVDGMTLTAAGFVVAVVIFVVASVLLEPLMRQVALKNAPAMLGSSSLIATLASLIVTALVSDSLKLSGLGSWVWATVLVWAVGLAARMLLPMVIFKKVLRASRTGAA